MKQFDLYELEGFRASAAEAVKHGRKTVKDITPAILERLVDELIEVRANCTAVHRSHGKLANGIKKALRLKHWPDDLETPVVDGMVRLLREEVATLRGQFRGAKMALRRLAAQYNAAVHAG